MCGVHSADSHGRHCAACTCKKNEYPCIMAHIVGAPPIHPLPGQKIEAKRNATPLLPFCCRSPPFQCRRRTFQCERIPALKVTRRCGDAALTHSLWGARGGTGRAARRGALRPLPSGASCAPLSPPDTAQQRRDVAHGWPSGGAAVNTQASSLPDMRRRHRYLYTAQENA